MPTPRLTGTIVASITTPSFYWSADYSCADAAENYFYWFNKNNGDMFKAALPNLTGVTQIATIDNISSMRAMIAHPTDPGLLVFFNSTDGVGTIDTTTGDVAILQDVATFNALFTGTQLELLNMTYVRLRDGKLMVGGFTDQTGAVFLYDVDAGTADLIVRSNGYQVSAENGPTSNELVLGSYNTLTILYIRSLTTDEIRMLAGLGTVNALIDGDALRVAQLPAVENLRQAAADLYYFRDGGNHRVRWIQGGLVGSYDAGVLGGDNFCCLLPLRGMAVSVEVQGVTVWS